jgi:C4-dicarboxylate-specific signal transduction histidine kinase
LLIFVTDAAVSAWKRGLHQRALVLGGVTFFSIVLAVIFSNLMVKGILPGAFISLCFLFIVLAMSYELSMDLVQAHQLANDLDVSQQRMRLAASAADLGMWEWDIIRDRVWTSETGPSSPMAVDLQHLTIDRYFELIHEDDREPTRHALKQALEGNGELQTELRLVGPGETIRWITVRGQVERDTNGKPLQFRGVSMDITERKQAEIELQRHRRDLAHAARVSTLGQLSSSLAHEINQPLGAILRNAEAAELFLKRSPLDLDELRAILADIRQDDQRASSVIERMRLLLTRRELQFETIEVGALIEQVVSFLRAEIQMQHAILRIDLQGEIPRVSGDRVHLQQVLINLLLNSLDALNGTPVAQRQIEIHVTQNTDSMVEIAVLDRGPGITSEQMPHLFEPFFTTKIKGSGIGLAISKTIVDMHGGRIRAENNPDGGATVRFTLRVAKQEDRA